MRKIRNWRRWLVLLLIVLTVVQMWRVFGYNTGSLPKSYNRGTMATLHRVSNDTNTTSPILKRSVVPILLWWDSVYTSVDEIRTCGGLKCRITSNRSLKTHHDTKMFLFYGSHFKPYNLPFPRQPAHQWALIHEESPRNAYVFAHPPSLSIFNYTSSYSRKSSYPITTQWLQCSRWIHDTKYVLPLVDKNRLRQVGLAPILYIQSDCDVPSDRDTFVRTLQNYIPVDSYGSCVNNRKMPERIRFRDTMAALDDHHFYQFAARYKFTLAMENYVCDDYITEKFWRPLRLGSVPIVFGAPNIKEYLPNNKSAIIVEDFEDIEDLANYISLLDRNNQLYKQYLSFKEQPITNNLKSVIGKRHWYPDICDDQPSSKSQNEQHRSIPESIFSGYECYLCRKIFEQSDNQQVHRETNDQLTHFSCPSPRMFDRNGRYSVHNATWSAEWNYGKFESAALMEVYRSQKVLSKLEFDKLAHAIQNDEDYSS